MFEILTQVALPISLILIMAGVGMGLTPADFGRVIAQPKAFMIGTVCQMVLLPLIAIGIIELTGLTGPLAIGLFILALCPGGTTSNLYTLLARGDVGLSVSLTAVIGFITPFTIPILGAWAIHQYGNADQTFELPLAKTWIGPLRSVRGSSHCWESDTVWTKGFSSSLSRCLRGCGGC